MLIVLMAIPVTPCFAQSSAVEPKTKEWTTLDGCTLLDNPSNDGDSFHIRHQGKEYIIRLYFVDAPEIESRFPDRVKAQADYFGISEADALKVGEEAAKFTKAALAKPFKIDTRFQDAMGASKLPRQYGVVTVVDGKDLGEMLVERGLARIHGINVGGIGAERVARLRRLEEEAKQKKAGAWGKTTHSSPPHSIAP